MRCQRCLYKQYYLKRPYHVLQPSWLHWTTGPMRPSHRYNLYHISIEQVYVYIYSVYDMQTYFFTQYIIIKYSHILILTIYHSLLYIYTQYMPLFIYTIYNPTPYPRLWPWHTSWSRTPYPRCAPHIWRVCSCSLTVSRYWICCCPLPY